MPAQGATTAASSGMSVAGVPAAKPGPRRHPPRPKPLAKIGQQRRTALVARYGPDSVTFRSRVWVRAGDIIAVGYSPETPHGLLRRATQNSVGKQASTEQITLADALKTLPKDTKKTTVPGVWKRTRGSSGPVGVVAWTKLTYDAKGFTVTSTPRTVADKVAVRKGDNQYGPVEYTTQFDVRGMPVVLTERFQLNGQMSGPAVISGWGRGLITTSSKAGPTLVLTAKVKQLHSGDGLPLSATFSATTRLYGQVVGRHEGTWRPGTEPVIRNWVD